MNNALTHVCIAKPDHHCAITAYCDGRTVAVLRQATEVLHSAGRRPAKCMTGPHCPIRATHNNTAIAIESIGEASSAAQGTQIGETARCRPAKRMVDCAGACRKRGSPANKTAIPVYCANLRRGARHNTKTHHTVFCIPTKNLNTRATGFRAKYIAIAKQVERVEGNGVSQIHHHRPRRLSTQQGKTGKHNRRKNAPASQRSRHWRGGKNRGFHRGVACLSYEQASIGKRRQAICRHARDECAENCEPPPSVIPAPPRNGQSAAWERSPPTLR